MFDDQLKNSGNQAPGSPPPDLPFAEPDDMLAGVDPVQDMPAPSVPSAPPVADPIDFERQQQSEVPPTALDAGVLKPIQPVASSASVPTPTVDAFSSIPVAPPESTPSVQPISSASPMRPQMDAVQTPPELPRDADYSVKGPSLSRGIMTIVIISVILLILGGGGFWVYRQITQSDKTAQPVIPTTTVNTQQPVNTAEVQVPSSTDSLDGSATTVDDQVLFGAPVDSDSDGLDDDREAELGLDPDNWDTDGDNLSDGDEVLIWKTDPKNTDTDGDSYLDGTEVKSGYNPNGEGRIFAAPKQDGDTAVSSSTVSSSSTSALPSVSSTVSAKDFGIPFTELGSCDQVQLNAIVLESIQALQGQGYVVDENVANNPEVFALLTADMEQRIRVCGVGPGTDPLE